ncbi:metal-dependent transcriptional regulator [Pseudoclavibacter alba]|uniref:Metal-dependent transcriptional regulator n=1 Tax=Pseudoclavibacter albus TaxID=272241 RepID=A0ABT2HWH5_9MICO|nr:metal-dependent transcriptional regulator [Pseudoclavibacter alba]MBN6777375.1 metal-dependent transcriptional regulator [Pseudoclavibacter alba]MCT2042669.1 metal-dependent transcriptional regulator [Pseudoclavibacter alba]
MANLVDTTEMYLRTILDLEEEGITPLRARISERLGHSGPTVSQTIARMERDGLVAVAKDRRLELTDEGREVAVRVLRKHRLAEGLLSQVIGLGLDQVHDEACRWEHVMSDEAEAKIFELLGRPSQSPYGTPIPGLEALGAPAACDFLAGVDSVGELASNSVEGERSSEVIVRRLGEPIQSDQASLEVLVEAGVLPDARITIERVPDGVAVFRTGSDAGVVLPLELADHLYVAAQ